MPRLRLNKQTAKRKRKLRRYVDSKVTEVIDRILTYARELTQGAYGEAFYRDLIGGIRDLSKILEELRNPLDPPLCPMISRDVLYRGIAALIVTVQIYYGGQKALKSFTREAVRKACRELMPSL